MQPTLHRGYILRLSISTFKLAVVCILLSSTLALAQDSPSRFEAGSNFIAVHLGRIAFFGSGVEKDINFGRHIAPDAAYSWLPTSPSRLTGLFGAKVGTRTGRFGFFGKVRTGFISIGDTLRNETFMFGPGPADFASMVRFGRLTKRALDFGGVMEYHPTHQWELRWNFGDTVVFGEPESILHMITVDSGVSPILPFMATPGRTSKNFQFSTTIRFRF